MKIDEALLIGGAILAALVLSKGQDISSSINGFFKESSVPVMPLENKNKDIIENFSEIQKNIQIQNIINNEEKQKNQRINYLQNESNKFEDYIIGQQKMLFTNLRSAEFNKIAPQNISPDGGFLWKGINLLEKFDRDSFNSRTGSLFPDFALSNTRENRDIIAAQAQREIFQQNIEGNIARATEYLNRQQTDIDTINEEYQTRFGGLLRYG